ncbi:MAG: hypothetical protein AAFR60_10065, partial [Pseudomonadota bacterium]
RSLRSEMSVANAGGVVAAKTAAETAIMLAHAADLSVSRRIIALRPRTYQHVRRHRSSVMSRTRSYATRLAREQAADTT